MNQLLIFPSWILYLIANCFIIRTHKWYNLNMNLKEFSKYGTPILFMYSISFWVLLLGVLLLTRL